MSGFKIESRQFTLIELLVVVAIIGVLAAILLPALKKARERAGITTCMNQHRQTLIAINAYAVDFDDWLPMGYSAYWMFFQTDTSNRPGGLGLLAVCGYVGMHRNSSFSSGGLANGTWCPGSRATWENGKVNTDSFWNAFNLRRFEGWGGRRDLLSKFPVTYPAYKTRFTMLMSCASGYVNTWPGHPTLSVHGNKGVNVGYYDGSAKWYSWPPQAYTSGNGVSTLQTRCFYRADIPILARDWWSPGLLDQAYLD